MARGVAKQFALSDDDRECLEYKRFRKYNKVTLRHFVYMPHTYESLTIYSPPPFLPLLRQGLSSGDCLPHGSTSGRNGGDWGLQMVNRGEGGLRMGELRGTTNTRGASLRKTIYNDCVWVSAKAINTRGTLVCDTLCDYCVKVIANYT